MAPFYSLNDYLNNKNSIVINERNTLNTFKHITYRY